MQVVEELDYIEQTSWIIFLKYINDLEKEKEISAELKDEKYNSIISKSLVGKNGQHQKIKKVILITIKH